MNFEQLHTYLIEKNGVSYDYPFDEYVRVYRVCQKIFALFGDTIASKINLKCDPIYALELRSLYTGIEAGYHMSKKHWNTIATIGSDVDDELLKELIDHSYDLVVASLTKKQRETLR